ncbi:GNAT family N-acetyltransferase [Olleya sp. R77988]|uniref:GNAT family N-acetyltransferase n=1 Tax=Olleya sp. R77988 TaxID=3093875 RepID=UPI0037CB1D9D
MTFDHFKIALLQPNDSVAFFNLIENNRERLEDFFAGTVTKNKTLEESIVYCKQIQKRIEAKTYFPYMITDLNTNTIIGLIDVKNIDWNVPKAELGAFIDANFESNGIVTKAGELVINHIIEIYAFKKLLCRANHRNKGSIAVILKLGFELEGTIRRDYKTTKGEIVDLNYYGRIF